MVPTQYLILLAAGFIGLLHGVSAHRDLDWWETTLMYQIYPRSFKDSNGDGIGDINGIYEKLDYLKDIGIESVIIQTFFKSPMADMGYDVADYRAIDPMFGSMEDFKKLIKGMHDREIKLLLDFVPNHTSDESEWFKLSENRVEPYTDYYIWKDPVRFNATHTTHPNNWRCVFGGSAWAWSEKRKQYYYHVFAKKQPDLNYRNPKVLQAMDDALRFWLDLGVDGFRVDAVAYTYEAEHFEDEPAVPNFVGENDYSSLRHVYTRSLPENYELTHRWRLLFDEYKKKDGKTRIICTEAPEAPGSDLVMYIGNDTYPMVHTPFYFKFVFLSYEDDATIIDDAVHDMLDLLPKDRLPNWVTNSHDESRISTRFGAESIDSINMISLLLPGSAQVYYGAEIGLEDSLVRVDQKQDPQNKGGSRLESRDTSRGPMAWNNKKNAGFTSNNRAWLPLHHSYWRKNVETETQEPKSHLNVFKRLAQLRNTPVIKHGDLRTFVLSKWLYMFTRGLEKEKVAVIVNLGSESQHICARDMYLDLPDTMFVHTSSLNAGFNTGDKVSVSKSDGRTCAELRPKAGLVLSTSAGFRWRQSCLLAMVTFALHLFRRIN